MLCFLLDRLLVLTSCSYCRQTSDCSAQFIGIDAGFVIADVLSNCTCMLYTQHMKPKTKWWGRRYQPRASVGAGSKISSVNLSFKPRIHDIIGWPTRWPTGWKYVYTTQYTSHNRFASRLPNRLANRLYCVNGVLIRQDSRKLHWNSIHS